MKILIILLVIVASVWGEKGKKYHLNREKQLIAGVVLLHHSDKYLTNMETNIYIKELLKVTGYSPKDAHRIINKYKNRPDKFKKVLEQIEAEMKGKKKNGK